MPSVGSFTYTPSKNFDSADKFTYKVSDGTVSSNIATINIQVSAVNDPPVGQDLDVVMDENKVYNGQLIATDPDVPEDPLTFSLDAQAKHGTAVVNSDGAVALGHLVCYAYMISLRLILLHSEEELRRQRSVHLHCQRR